MKKFRMMNSVRITKNFLQISIKKMIKMKMNVKKMMRYTIRKKVKKVKRKRKVKEMKKFIMNNSMIFETIPKIKIEFKCFLVD